MFSASSTPDSISPTISHATAAREEPRSQYPGYTPPTNPTSPNHLFYGSLRPKFPQTVDFQQSTGQNYPLKSRHSLNMPHRPNARVHPPATALHSNSYHYNTLTLPFSYTILFPTAITISTSQTPKCPNQSFFISATISNGTMISTRPSHLTSRSSARTACPAQTSSTPSSKRPLAISSLSTDRSGTQAVRWEIGTMN